MSLVLIYLTGQQLFNELLQAWGHKYHREIEVRRCEGRFKPWILCLHCIEGFCPELVEVAGPNDFDFRRRRFKHGVGDVIKSKNTLKERKARSAQTHLYGGNY
jgi:hypothetical protein